MLAHYETAMAAINDHTVEPEHAIQHSSELLLMDDVELTQQDHEKAAACTDSLILNVREALMLVRIGSTDAAADGLERLDSGMFASGKRRVSGLSEPWDVS